MCYRSKTYPSFLTVKEGFFLPLRLSCKESSTFLTKPLFNGLYTPFGSPVPGGQKPQEREDVTALWCSEPLRYKVGGPSKVSPCFAGWDRLEITCYYLDKWGVSHQYSVTTILQVVTPISFLKKVILYQYCRRLT